MDTVIEETFENYRSQVSHDRKAIRIIWRRNARQSSAAHVRSATARGCLESLSGKIHESDLRVVRALGRRFRDRRRTGSFRLWLKNLAQSSWIDLNRQNDRQLAKRHATDRGKSIWNGPTSKEGYDHLTELCDAWATQEILEMATVRVRDRVDESTWMTYVMLVDGQRTIEQVTESFGISTKQAYNRLFRVRRYLKQEIETLDAEPF